LELLINHADANQQIYFDIVFADLNQNYIQEHQPQELQQINGENVIINNLD
jgi:hypothetical protein